MATKSRIPVRVTKVSRSTEKAACMQRDDKPTTCTTKTTTSDTECLQVQPSTKAKCSRTKSGSAKSVVPSETKPAPASRAATAATDRKPPLRWKNAEPRVPTITRVAKPRALQEVRVKHVNSNPGQAAVAGPSSSKQRVSSLAEQQQAMGIAFEADSRALDSILTGKGVTAPLLDRTASLNVPAGVRHLQTQGPRKGGSMFGSRPSVYAPCESRFNFRDGLIQWKPTSDARQAPDPAECPVPVVTPFRESGIKSIYKVPERHSVYVKYVTENELCAANVKQFHRSPSRLTIATPGRVRIGLNKPPTLETPYLERKDDNSNLASSTRPSLPLWRDINTRKDGDQRLPLLNAVRKYEVPQDTLRRTLTFAESEMEGTVERTDSIGTSGQRMQSVLLDGAVPMTRLSEADEEELLGIEEMERRLQLEIEAMEQAKGENLQRMATVLRNCVGFATALASPEAGGPDVLLTSNSGAVQLLPHVDLAEEQQQQQSLGSSPELSVPAARSLLLRSGRHSEEMPVAQPAMFSCSDAAAAAVPSPATTCSVAVVSPTPASVTVELSSRSKGTAVDCLPSSSAAAFQQLQPAAFTPDSSSPATYSPVCSLSALATADGDFRLSRQMPPVEPGASCRLSVVHPLESTECLRSQSQLIAAIDRLGRGGSNAGSDAAAAAAAAIAEQQLQSATWPPTVVPSRLATALTATAASGLASGGCLCSVAAIDDCSSGHATTADAVAAEFAGNDKLEGLSTWESVSLDQANQCPPVFLIRAGTISVLDCGAYSPLPAAEAATATSAAGVDRGGGIETSASTLCRGCVTRDELTALPAADGASSFRAGPPGCDSITNSLCAVRATLSECGALEFGHLEPPAAAELDPGERFPAAPEPSCSPRRGAFACIGQSASVIVRPRSALLDAPLLLPVPSAVGTVGTAAAPAANSAPQPTMPLNLVRDCRSDFSSSPAASSSAELSCPTTVAAAPELVGRPSFIDLVSSASERFETALLDEECTLYLCRASSRRLSSASRDNAFTNPVAYTLTNGDSQHFVPIRSCDVEDSPVLPVASPDGSAFRCYTPY